jgi:hypothetical protein
MNAILFAPALTSGFPGCFASLAVTTLVQYLIFGGAILLVAGGVMLWAVRFRRKPRNPALSLPALATGRPHCCGPGQKGTPPPLGTAPQSHAGRNPGLAARARRTIRFHRKLPALTAMQQSQAITRKSASNLALAFILLPKPKRDAMATLYAFCREVDDVADEDSVSVADRRKGLAAWRTDVKTRLRR